MKFFVIRGYPGSGKTTLARKLAADGVLISIDDYLPGSRIAGAAPEAADGVPSLPPGEDIFTSGRVASAWALLNQVAAVHIAERVPRIVVELVGAHLWEVKDLWRLAMEAGYEVDVVEPQTEWARDVRRCRKITSHIISRRSWAWLVKEWEGPPTRENIEQSVTPEERLQQARWIASQCDAARTPEEKSTLERFALENYSPEVLKLTDDGFWGPFGPQRREVFRRKMKAENQSPPVITVLHAPAPDQRLSRLQDLAGPDPGSPEGPGVG